MLRNLLREKKIFIKVYLIIIFRRSYILLLSIQRVEKFRIKVL